jgi:tripartite-type tricarboxylate transporter receptor subunit TctC
MTGKGLTRVLLPTLLLASLAAPNAVYADTWPQRPVRILASAAGSSSDAAVRTLAEKLSKRWKQPVVVENRPSPDHLLTVQGLVESRDGHTLLFVTHSAFTVNPLLHEKLPYDPVNDVTPISLVVDDFLSVVTSPTLPVHSLTELVAHARSKPRHLNSYAVPGSPYLALLAFQKRAGIETTFVAYRNLMTTIPDLAQGSLHMAILPFAAVRGAVQASQVKVLAVTNEQRTPAAPEISTAAQAGFPDLTFGGLLGLFGPKAMHTDLRERVASEVREALAEADVQQRLTNLGLAARGTSAAEFARILDEQRVKWATIAKEHGIKPGSRN